MAEACIPASLSGFCGFQEPKGQDILHTFHTSLFQVGNFIPVVFFPLFHSCIVRVYMDMIVYNNLCIIINRSPSWKGKYLDLIEKNCTNWRWWIWFVETGWWNFVLSLLEKKSKDLLWKGRDEMQYLEPGMEEMPRRVALTQLGY